ncbi:matrix-remodeling-associated protein 7-like [Rhagoletis pomonella]|uniref:matrix-remodeling-associated protein 7-like n=1 Tax=Rhagoletis pomonella TaxID=28610 RepID=UPI0017822C3E|nr:matrix-remodeling-associated protein 7-like [Rhagoletis pomonella]XP_036342214.1 matrix-remodeling-associated protein 7-like [Rhagoletis pomonella]XP_036342215.1 matrix-remodeling-associated protein 7-like [Rhagoletis pomonella]XP_036342216.1 matrix-remodeling-associated protein 7-like [Rhagoletis pomonella]XP_036342236.1 matrix-remodeling-associated protein 7-like [Rhagoletis pomonella]XP_036342237.1 matrix-remodeling-associated protein 7-like [Rhagoletis pomonella]XP_036342238.1 matrix-r
MYALLGISEVFDSFDNVFLLSTVTMLAAVILAFYFSNLVKDIGMPSIQEEREIEEQNSLSAMEERTEGLYDGSDDEDFDTDNPLGDGLVGKLKSARLKELEAQLTHDQLEEERRIEREQLAAIFELLKKQEAELNMKEIDERELVAQLNLYR